MYVDELARCGFDIDIDIDIGIGIGIVIAIVIPILDLVPGRHSSALLSLASHLSAEVNSPLLGASKTLKIMVRIGYANDFFH